MEWAGAKRFWHEKGRHGDLRFLTTSRALHDWNTDLFRLSLQNVPARSMPGNPNLTEVTCRHLGDSAQSNTKRLSLKSFGSSQLQRSLSTTVFVSIITFVRLPNRSVKRDHWARRPNCNPSLIPRIVLPCSREYGHTVLSISMASTHMQRSLTAHYVHALESLHEAQTNLS